MKLRNFLFLLFSMVTLIMAGCGDDNNGGGGGGGGAAGTTVSGAAAKGPINGGTVTFWTISSNGKDSGHKLTSTPAVVTTAANGTYGPVTLTHTGPLNVQVTGGTYSDEATGVPTPLTGKLQNVIANASGAITVPLTTLTTLALDKAGNLTRLGTGKTAVNNLVNNLLETNTFDIDKTSTTDDSYKFSQGVLSQLLANMKATAPDTTLDNVLTRVKNGINDTGAITDAALKTDLNKAVLDFSANVGNTTAIKFYSVTVTAGANGTVTPAAKPYYKKGASQTFTITANNGFVVKDVLLDGVSQGVVATLTLSNIAANHTIAVTFGTPAPVQNTLAIVKVATSGAVGGIGSITAHVLANPSAGLTIAAADITKSGVGVGDTNLLAPNIANIANITLGFISSNAAGIAVGEFTTLQYHIAVGTFPTAADFTIAAGASVTDVNSAAIPGDSVVIQSVTFQ